MPTLSNLIAHFPEYSLPRPALSADPDVTGVSADSRRIGPGWIFVAVTGGTTDGHAYIPDALRRGAVAVVGSRPLVDLPVAYVRVGEPRLALAVLAAGLHGFPARRLTVIGVTGTDGKTTTANLVYHALRAAGIRAGMISTVNAVIGDETLDTGFHVTTPDAPAVQGYLDRMVAAGLTHVVLEATSHGLAQARVAACDFDLGVATNVTHEHLDYHGSFENYRAAKGLLFSGLGQSPPKSHRPPQAAVLNRDDSSHLYFAALTSLPALTYGLTAGDVHLLDPDRVDRRDGLRFVAAGRDLAGERFEIPLASRMSGDFNLWNLLAAVALARGALRLPDEAVAAGIAAVPGIPGRMERIEMGQDFVAIVDFAHTPNALRAALEAARRLTAGRVIAVFGSAGLRDRAKRRLMAETAADLADVSVLTAEDPRTESLDAILSEMAAGAAGRGGVEGRTYFRIPDRRNALRFALDLARSGDLVIACGKGHEQSMCFGETEYAWDDRQALRAALAEYLGVPGPQMPELPDV